MDVVGFGHQNAFGAQWIRLPLPRGSRCNRRPRPSALGEASQAQRSMAAICASSWRSPVAGVRSLSRSICSALSSSGRRRCSPRRGRPAWCRGSGRCRRPGRAARPGRPAPVWRPTSEATASTSSTMRRLLLEVLAGEARVGLAPVVVGELLGGADRAGEEAVAERRVGHEADAQLAQQRQQLGLRVTGPQRVLGLQRGDRVDGVGAADRLGAGLGQADVPDLALGDQLGQRADGLLDRRVRVDPVLVVEVDAVGAEPLQGALDGGADVRRAAVEHPGPPPACETKPNFVASTTSSRRSLRARPTSSSLAYGP